MTAANHLTDLSVWSSAPALFRQLCGALIRVRRNASLLLIAIALLVLPACGKDKTPSTLSGSTMGTTWSVVLAKSIPDTAVAGLRQLLIGELARINALMSTYDPASELSEFNNSENTSAVQLHANTLHVLDAALDISAQTDGAYDVTLGPVIELWGFGTKPESTELPSQSQIMVALQNSGYRKILRATDSVQKSLPAMRIDLSSIAKGYAVDSLGGLLELHGYADYSIEIGGEVRTRGVKADKSAWLIGIEMPDGKADEGVAVNNAHLASSGSYRNYHEQGGVRYSHLIDGRTGYPIRNTVAAATVIHPVSTMLADAWATAFMILPATRSLQLAEKLQMALQLTVKTDDGFSVQRNAAFEQLLHKSN